MAYSIIFLTYLHPISQSDPLPQASCSRLKIVWFISFVSMMTDVTNDGEFATNESHSWHHSTASVQLSQGAPGLPEVILLYVIIHYKYECSVVCFAV